MRRWALYEAGVLLLPAAVLLSAACSSGDTTPRTPPAEVPAGAPFVDQDNLQFHPTELTVTAGQTVYFKNSETALHTVTVDGKNLSGTMRKGDLFTWTPAEPGTYKITCEFHPQMKAQITVQ